MSSLRCPLDMQQKIFGESVEYMSMELVREVDGMCTGWINYLVDGY